MGSQSPCSSHIYRGGGFILVENPSKTFLQVSYEFGIVQIGIQKADLNWVCRLGSELPGVRTLDLGQNFRRWGIFLRPWLLQSDSKSGIPYMLFDYHDKRNAMVRFNYHFNNHKMDILVVNSYLWHDVHAWSKIVYGVAEDRWSDRASDDWTSRITFLDVEWGI